MFGHHTRAVKAQLQSEIGFVQGIVNYVTRQIWWTILFTSLSWAVVFLIIKFVW